MEPELIDAIADYHAAARLRDALRER